MIKDVPDLDHISRFCRKNSVTEDGRITGQAFKLRPEDKGGYSVNWLEYLELPDRESEVNKVRTIYEEKNLAVKDGAMIAVLNVGETRKYIYEKSPDKRKIQVTNEEPENDPSHSRLIGNLTLEDTKIFDLLAEVADKEKYPAKIPCRP